MVKGPTETLVNMKKEYQTELYNLENPERKLLMDNEQSRRCADLSDTSRGLFFKKYKSIAKQQWINTIKKGTWEEGKEPTFEGTTTTAAEVPFQLQKFYQMLFSKKIIDNQIADRIYKKMSENKILTATRDKLEKDITAEEIEKVMINLPVGKQPGPDRIPNAVYKYLPQVFAPLLAEVIDDAAKHGELPKSFLQGDIGLIYKKEDRDDPRNYRPITMLQNAYKIFTRVLAHRMREAVHEFVSETQKGFVPKAFIAECTMLLTLIENYINEDADNREGLMIFLDMEKAFDRCSYEFLLKAMEATGFGPKFCALTKLMYDENITRHNAEYTQTVTTVIGLR